MDPGTYYIAVNHRNGLETWSKAGVAFPDSRGVQEYDFTYSDSRAYGNNLTLKNSKYCIYSGDVNQDQSIDLDDVIFVFNDASQFTSGYVNTDVNGDGITDLDDLIITNYNSNNFMGILDREEIDFMGIN